MMFKVLIVDDEAIIRKGLKNIIDWRSLECEVGGEAGDGVEGLSYIKSVEPDIIITDINMPGLDGLKMIKETKELIPHCKIIILTGHRDFAYIQEAIKLGAFDYILKPSKIEDIMIIIRRAVEKLKHEKCKEEELAKLKKELQQKVPVLKQKLLYDIIFNINLKGEDVVKELLQYDIEISDFVVLVVETEGDETTNNCNKKNQIFRYEIANTLKEVFLDTFKIVHVPINKHQIVFIIQKEDSNDLISLVKKSSMELQELVNGCFNISITISISSIGNGPFELSEKTREALEALKYKTSLGANSIIIFSELENMYKNVSIIEKNKNEELDINEDKPKIISATLRRAVEYINNHYQELITLNDVAEYTYLSTYYLSRMFTKELNKNFVDYLNEIRIEKAKEYLKDSRYKTYEIAEMVGIKDPHYFSKLFKKYTGNTPSEYRIQ